MKVDLKRTMPAYAVRKGVFDLVEVPPLQYLAVDGSGDPNTSRAYREALEAIYPVAYALKFASKQDLGRDYVVMPLEALWWADDMSTFTSARDKSQWHWTMLNLVPDWLTRADVDHALDKAAAKPDPSPALKRVRLELLDEGLCVQTLHVGSYDDEAPVLARMHDEFIPQQGLRMTGRHHEVYFSDARRVAPERLRTLLRQPVERR